MKRPFLLLSLGLGVLASGPAAAEQPIEAVMAAMELDMGLIPASSIDTQDSSATMFDVRSSLGVISPYNAPTFGLMSTGNVNNIEALEDYDYPGTGADTSAGDRAEEERRRAIVDHHMTGLEGSLVSDRIADTLDGYYSEWRNEPVGSQWLRLVGKMQGRVRSFEKMVNWIRPGHNNNRGFVQHMFEDLTPQDIDLRLALFRHSLGRFDRVRGRQVAHNVFELSG